MAPVLIMAIGTFMVLDQLQIAPQIVTITYAALLGGLFLAMALAFGLGGRDVANRMLSEAYDRERDRRRGRFSRDSTIDGERAPRARITPVPRRPSADRAMARLRTGAERRNTPARVGAGAVLARRAGNASGPSGPRRAGQATRRPVRRPLSPA